MEWGGEGTVKQNVGSRISREESGRREDANAKTDLSRALHKGRVSGKET